jgi:hypothetical protein
LYGVVAHHNGAMHGIWVVAVGPYKNWQRGFTPGIIIIMVPRGPFDVSKPIIFQ